MTGLVIENNGFKWRYGNRGGGEWSQGQYLPTNKLVDRNYPVKNTVDLQFKSHDINYEDVMTKYVASEQKADDVKEFWRGIMSADAMAVIGLKAERGCGVKLGLIYAVSPRLSRYSMGLSEPRDILMRFSLYQRM